MARYLSVIVWILAILTACNPSADTITGTGTLSYELRDNQNKLIPGKIILLDEDGDKVNISLTKQDDLAFRQNTLYTLSGAGALDLPAGEYTVWAGRGLEWSGYRQSVTIKPESTTQFTAKLEKQLMTPGYVGGDMHLHTFTFSGHGDSNVDERMVSCIGEGLEWAVATDHNHVVDYKPYLEKFGATSLLSTTVGNEVSTPIGHFNTYPLPPGSEPVKSDISDANELFALIRQPDEDVVIQVNHPRWPSGDYFTFKNVDEYYGATDDKSWSWNFDAIEILNVNSGLGWIEEAENPISVKRDWFNLLNKGRRITGLGNSDSHTVLINLAGLPRNYIASSSDEIDEINERELSQAIREMNVSVSRGLYIEFSSGDTPIGSTTSTAADGSASFSVRVQGADWVDCDTVMLIRNGVTIQKYPVKSSDSVLRFDRTLIDKPDIDSWYIVVAKGNDPMTPLGDNADGSFFPLAFTNPIWVDADGDNQITSVQDRAIGELKRQPVSKSDIQKIIATHPEFMPFIGEFIVNGNLINREDLLVTLAEGGDYYTRVFLYRSLGKIRTARSRSLLAELEAASPTILDRIEVKLAGSSYFNEEDREMRKALVELRDQLKFYRSGAEQPEYEIAYYSSPGALLDGNPDSKKLTHGSKDGYLSLPDSENKTINFNVFSRQHANASFFVAAESAIYFIGENGPEEIFSEDMPQGTTIEVAVSKGENMLRFDPGKNEKLLMEPVYSGSSLIKNPEGITYTEHTALDQSYTEESKPGERYSGGIMALTDGFTGSQSYWDGFWCGYNGTDLDVTIDLEKTQSISKISTTFLQNQGAWIFLPAKVRFMISADGINFEELKSISFDIEKSGETVLQEVSSPVSKDCRYIKVIAENIETLPDWHNSKGQSAWLFVDEIIVE